MRIESLAKVTGVDAEQICHLAAAAGHQLVEADGVNGANEVSPAGFLSGLVEAGNFDAAVKFLAFALPRREAVWWACVCARLELQEPVEDVVMNALVAAETWVRKPTDEHRRAAMVCAQAARFESPAAWAAVGAFWSSGSMAPVDVPEVPPAAHLLGVAITGAVTLAAVQFRPELAEERRQRFVAVGVNIANGGNGREELGQPAARVGGGRQP